MSLFQGFFDSLKPYSYTSSDDQRAKVRDIHPTEFDIKSQVKFLSAKYVIRAELIGAIIAQESSGNTLAKRYEPAFYDRYIVFRGANTLMGFVPPKMPLQTEKTNRSTSWGLMQVMGETAREIGFNEDCFEALLIPARGLEFGCRLFNQLWKKHHSNETLALLAYNGGGNKEYPAQVLKRIETGECYKYCDR